MKTLNIAAFALVALFVSGLATAADEPAKEAPKPPRAARSVHLWWSAPECTDFYNEMTVERSTRGSYFMACGFGHGYFGMQELNGKPNGLAGDGGNTNKVVIFSIWDHYKGDDAKAVPPEKRVELLHQGEGVRIGRFSGEGTGGQSFFTYDWQPGETCRFLVRAKAEGNKTVFSGYFYLPAEKRWHHLVSFRTITGGKHLSGLYSFVEDFRRDGKSPDEARVAHYGNGWVRTLESGQWQPLTKVRFTGDRTPLDNVDAGLKNNRFYLATGGETKNTNKIGSTLERSPIEVGVP